MGKGWIADEGRLDLSHSRLSFWPSSEIEYVGASRVRVLDLDGNQIQEVPGRDILRLPNLVSLHMAGNGLQNLPPELARLDLEVLDIRDNPLSELPPSARVSGEAALAFLRGPSATPASPKPPRTPRSPAKVSRTPPASAPPPGAGAASPRAAPVPAPCTCGAPRPCPARPPLPPSSGSPAPSNASTGGSSLHGASSAPAPAPAPTMVSVSVSAPAAPAGPAAGPSPSGSGAAATGCGCSVDPAAMKVADVSAWLRSLELGRLVPAFERNSVDGKTLLGLGERDLAEDLHVESAVLRRRLLAEIGELARRCRAERVKTVREFIEDDYNPVVTDVYHAAIDYWTNAGIPVQLPEGYPRDVSSMRVTLVEIVKYDLYSENWRYCRENPRVFPDTKLIENEIYRCVVPRHLNAHVSDGGDIYVPQNLLASCAYGLPMLFLALLPPDPRYDSLYARVMGLASEVARVRCPLDPRVPIYAKHNPGPRIATPAPTGARPASPPVLDFADNMSPRRGRAARSQSQSRNRSSSLGPGGYDLDVDSPVSSPRRGARARSSSVGPGINYDYMNFQ
eukprot:tig00000204_g17738.t1